MVLMYLYRTRTDLENIECYIETFNFRRYGMKISDIPEDIQESSNDKIRALAYAEVGAAVPSN